MHKRTLDLIRQPLSATSLFCAGLLFLSAGLSTSLAAQPLPASQGTGYETRFYRSAEHAFVVDIQKNMLSVKAPVGTDPGAVAVAVDVALQEAKAESHVLRVKTLREREGYFALFLDDETPSEVLALVAKSLPKIYRAYPVLQRESGRAFSFDELILTAEPGQLDDVMRAVLAKIDGTFIRLSSVPNSALLRVGAAMNFDAVQASAEVTGLEGLVSLEPNMIREYALNAVDFDDPMLSQQWHLSRDDVVDVPGEGQVFAKEAWVKTTGSSDVVVAIFDTGIDLQHEDLVGNLIGGFDAVSGDDDASSECSPSQDGADYAESCPENAPFRESHGTAVSGTVAAVGNNGTGVVGVCPGCKLMPVRFIGAGAGSALGTAEAFIRAVDEGAHIINNSWGPGASIFFPLSRAERDAFEYARTQGRDGKGTLITFAAGNDTTDVILDSYASSHLTIAVSASTNLDDFALYSNFGETITVAAPSQGGTVEADSYGIVTTDFTGPEGYADGAYAPAFGGTSAACPVTSGVAGLVLSAHPDLTAEQLRLALTGSADKILADKVDWQAVIGQDLETLFAYDDNGHSRGFGYGRINAAAALELGGRIGKQGAVCTPGSDDVCSECSSAGRCEMPCSKSSDCHSGSICEEGYCRLPLPTPGDLGEACTADCEYCVAATNTQFEATSICTQTCSDDDPCPTGFTCRLLEAGGLGVCAVGSDQVGEPGDGFQCFSSNLFAGVVVQGDEGQPYCSDLCFDDGAGACPYGFHCGTADCVCTGEHRGRCFEYTCGETNGGGSGFDICFADEGFGVTCGHDDDCSSPDYCTGLDENADAESDRPGTCRPDDREGCDVCKQCTSEADCSLGTTCFANSRDAEYGYCTRFCGTNNDCPGDSECVEVFNSVGSSFVCASPTRPVDDNYICVDDWQCEVSCRDDVPCGDGEVCEEGGCVSAPEEVDPPTPEPEVPDSEPICGCSSTSASSDGEGFLFAFWLGLGSLMFRRRRKSRNA